MTTFSLASIKQIKYDEHPIINMILKKHTVRKRPVFPLLFNDAINIIAEVKKASPSNGTIKIVDPAKQAILYQNAGAQAISVLVDSHYFGGSFNDLYSVAQTVKLPVLCKEFICYKEQIDAAFVLGADMILLIANMLTKKELNDLYYYTIAKRLTPIIEVHKSSELENVLLLSPLYIMVNMRNLNTLQIDYTTGITTLHAIPSSITKICASGIDHSQRIKHIHKHTGTNVFLIGTALMQSKHPEMLLKELRNVC